MKEKIELFNALLPALIEAALDLYTRRYAVHKLYSSVSAYMENPETLQFSHIDGEYIHFVSAEDSQYTEIVSLEGLLDPVSSVENLKHDLIRAKEEAGLREAAKREQKRQEAIQQIEKLKREFNL